MAWYHVNECDCPIGCCDCGTPTEKKIAPDGKNVSHLDLITWEMVKNGICPSCLSSDEHCHCDEP